MALPSERGIPLSALSPKFLHTNSTSHTWPFSAIAELIDNAYDPDVKARQFWIDKTKVKDQDCLIFMDNGSGIDYEKMHKMLSFGFSEKQTINGHVPVGLYGNGFKSGSMRLGKDTIVFSKKAGTMCVGLLSQTYLKNTGAEHVVVPITTFRCVGQTIRPEPKHLASLQEIKRHSLFQNDDEILSELKAISGSTGSSDSPGTRIIIWNLRKTTSGAPEFDFLTDRYDIQIPVEVYESSNEQNRRLEYGIQSTPQSTYSLRAYCSILYLKPRMQIIIRGQKVKTELVSKSLALIVKDKYKPYFLPNMTIPITFGYNTKSKEHYGIMMYHKNRLIKAYERVGCQLKANRTGVGVIGVIECDFLKPTHNKQDFDSTDEYRKTINNVGTKLEDYWKEIRHRLKTQDPSCTLPVEDTVKRPDQTWVQCEDCLKWRKLPDCIDMDKLPDKWFCYMNPDPQFRNCTTEEEPEDSDDEQVGYQKTYKQHERYKKLQQEKNRMQMEQEKKHEEQNKIAALKKQNDALMKKQQDLERQLKLSTPSSPSLAPCAGSMPTGNMPIISNVVSLFTTPKRVKRGLDPIRENKEAKRQRLGTELHSNSSNSPSVSMAEACSSPTTTILVDDVDKEACKNNEPAPKDDDDDVLIIEVSSTPRPKSVTFDLSKVKSESSLSEDTQGIHMCTDDISLESTVAMGNTAAETSSPSSEKVSVTTQTEQKLVKEEVEKEQDNGTGERDNNKSEKEQGIPPLGKKTNEDPEEKSMQGSPRAQLINVAGLEKESGERDESNSNCAAIDHVQVKSENQDGEPNSEELSKGSKVEAGETSVRGKDIDNLSVLEAQQQQDVLLELLEAASQERDVRQAEAQLLTSRIEELKKSMLELTENTLKKEQSEKSTQTTLADEEQDYKTLYLQASEETKQVQHELDKLKRERAEKVEGQSIAENEVQSKGDPARLDMHEVNDEIACQVDLLLRELDERNTEREELKSKLDSLEEEKQSLVTCCDKLQKDLDKIKKTSEESKVNVEERGAQTEFPNPGENEATSSGTSNHRRASSDDQNETQGRSEVGVGQDDKTMLACSIRLRELRQKVGRLLVTFVPALDLEQVNYDCEVIDEILSQVIDEISPNVA